MERHLPHGLAGRFGSQLEQLQHFIFAVEIGFDGLAEDALELFAVFKQRTSRTAPFTSSRKR